MTKFDELKQRFPNLIPVQELRANVSIVELALYYGYEPQVYKGKTRPVLTHPAYNDTIIIKNPHDAAQQLYQRAGDFADSGTIIDFVRNRLSTVFSKFDRPIEHEFRNLTSVLYDYLRIDPQQLSQHQKAATRLAEPTAKEFFATELFDLRVLEKTNYLNQRHIAPHILAGPEFTAKVVTQVAYFDTAKGHTEDFLTVKAHPERAYLQFKNVAFPYYNGISMEASGLELRNEKIKLHAAGSDRFNSVFVSNVPPKVENFYVMESAIDALSHRQLRSIRGDDQHNAVYFSTGGQLTPGQVNTISRYVNAFSKADNWRLNLCFDNDAKGHRFDLLFIQQMMADKFPMSPTVAAANRIAYILPGQETFRPIQTAILKRIDQFNLNVAAQFSEGPAESDTQGRRELNNRLIMVGMNERLYQISIPEDSGPMQVICKLLLEMTNLAERMKVEKAQGKDFNEDLTREIRLGQKFRYGIQDESGLMLVNGNSTVKMSRSMQQLKHQTESEGGNKTFILSERGPYGFLQPLVELKIVQGVTTREMQQPAFAERIQAEKLERHEQQPQQERQPKRALNPQDKPPVGQLPAPGHKPPGPIKPKHE